MSLADGEHLLRYAPYPDWQWLLVSDELADEANAENRHILLWLLGGVGVLLVCLVAAMALTTHRLVSRPLAKLLARCAASARRATSPPGCPRAAAMKSALAQAFNGLQDALQTRCAPPMTAPSRDRRRARRQRQRPPGGAGSHRQSQAAQSMAGEIDQLTQAIADIAHDTSASARLERASCPSAPATASRRWPAPLSKWAKWPALSGAASTLGAARQQAEQISAIVNVIDDIAEQTNLFGLERRHRSRPRWRAGLRFCRGGRRSAQAGRAHPGRHP